MFDEWVHLPAMCAISDARAGKVREVIIDPRCRARKCSFCSNHDIYQQTFDEWRDKHDHCRKNILRRNGVD